MSLNGMVAVSDEAPGRQAACACFTTSGDGFVVSTREGLRSYQLGQFSPDVSDGEERVSGDSRPTAPGGEDGGSTSWVRLPRQQRGAASSSGSWWWRRNGAVQAVAVAGDSAVIAVVFCTMPQQSRDEDEGTARSTSVSPLNRNPVRTGVTEGDGSRYVYLFEDTTGICLAELYFRGEVVLALRANTHLLLVATLASLHVVDLLTLRHLRQQSMFRPPNPHSILALSQLPSPRGDEHELNYRIAFPQSSQRRGDIAVLTIGLPRQSHSLDMDKSQRTVTEAVATAASCAATPGTVGRALVVRQELRSVTAHYRPVAVLSLDARGTLLASASVLGSTVKLFDAVTGQLLAQYQRGHLRAAVYALAISPRGTRVAAMSSTGTLHFFDCSAVAPPRGTVVGGTSDGVGMATQRSHLPQAIGLEKPRAVTKKTVLLPASRCGDCRADTAAVVAQERAAAPALPSAAEEGWVYDLHFTMDGAYVLAAVLAPIATPTHDTRSVNNAVSTEAGLLERFSVDGAQEEPEEVYRIIV